MNFYDALTHTKNTYVPEEIATDLVLGVAYDPSSISVDDPDINNYPAYTLSFEFIPASTRNSYWKDECNEAGEVVDGYRAYLSYFELPDNRVNNDNIECFTGNSPDELLAQLPVFALGLNYQVYTPTADSDLVVDLTDLLRALFPELPDDDHEDYKEAAITLISKYNSGVLPTGLTKQDIEDYFAKNPTLTVEAAFDHMLADLDTFASNNFESQMLGVVAAPKTSLVDTYIIALAITPAEYRMEAPHTVDEEGNAYNEYRAHVQGGTYGKPATVNSNFSANSLPELLELLPPIFDHVKYQVCLIGNGHKQHTTEQVLRKMFPELLATADEIANMNLSVVEQYEFDIEAQTQAQLETKTKAELACDLLDFKAAAFEVIAKSNF